MDLNFKFISPDLIRQSLPQLPDITYLPEYALFKERYYGLKSGIGALYDKDSKLRAAFPVQYSDNGLFVSHQDYSEPYIADNTDIYWRDVAVKLLKEFNSKLIQFRFYFPSQKPNLDISPDKFSAFIFDIKLNESEDDLMMRFDKKTRNQVRRALTSDLIIRHSGAEVLPDLLLLYKENMQRHGTPPKSDRFFKELFECFGNRAVAITAWHNSVLAGANILICGDDSARLLFNWSRQEYWPKYINDLLYWETIKYSSLKKMNFVDFGGSANQDVTHNHFKLGFGARPVPLFGFKSGNWSRRLLVWIKSKKRHLILRLNKIIK